MSCCRYSLGCLNCLLDSNSTISTKEHQWEGFNMVNQIHYQSGQQIIQSVMFAIWNLKLPPSLLMVKHIKK